MLQMGLMQLQNQAFAAGEESPLPPLSVQYGDHAAWERAWLQGEALDAELGWWRGALAGAPAVIKLPADRPRPAAQSYRGDTRRVRFSPALSAALRKMGSQASATPFMTLLAGFKALLHRWGAGDDLVVGTHVANRDRVEVERLYARYELGPLSIVGHSKGGLIGRYYVPDDRMLKRYWRLARDSSTSA